MPGKRWHDASWWNSVHVCLQTRSISVAIIGLNIGIVKCLCVKQAVLHGSTPKNKSQALRSFHDPISKLPCLIIFEYFLMLQMPNFRWKHVTNYWSRWSHNIIGIFSVLYKMHIYIYICIYLYSFTARGRSTSKKNTSLKPLRRSNRSGEHRSNRGHPGFCGHWWFFFPKPVYIHRNWSLISSIATIYLFDTCFWDAKSAQVSRHTWCGMKSRFGILKWLKAERIEMQWYR